MIKVLIVEDSRVIQEFLTHILSADPEVQVVGVAGDGHEALPAVRAHRPDVITMDIHMPKMGGYEATRLIMETAPTPIVIVSASPSTPNNDFSFPAIEAGALAVVRRPYGITHPEHAESVRTLIWTVKTMSEIKVVRRHAKSQIAALSAAPPVLPKRVGTEYNILAMGASTGGPPVLRTILALLPLDLGAPILIVQHIAPGFTNGFVEWLRTTSGFPVHVATHGQAPLAGHAYVAPDGMQMGLDNKLRITVSDHPSENGLRPSVSYLFRSVAQVAGSHAIGVLLTGMGQDGSIELKRLQQLGAVTIAQDQASSVVYGMPGEAVKLGAAKYILPPEAIAALIAELLKHDVNEGV